MEIPKTKVPKENPFSYLFNLQPNLEESIEKFIGELPKIIKSVREESESKTVFEIMEKVICRLKQVEIIEGTSPRVFPTKVEVQYSMENSESMLQKKFPQLNI